jgi:hypothetical protein
MTAEEGDIRFDFSSAVSWKRFDGEEHGLSHCMKAVDFVVYLSDRILFIEVKDPENPSAENAESFNEEFTTEKYIKDVLVQKCRDSYLYEYSYDNVSKPVHYSVVVGISKLSEPELLAITETLKHHIPISGPKKQPWPKRFIENCMVFSLETWNKYMPDFHVIRISNSGV